jgi:nucleoside-diphosphate-sugar epimerase
MVKYQVFGGHGFVGSAFVDQNPCACIVNEKIDYNVYDNCEQILYLISTITNYNMKINPYVDIETNLITLMRVLEQCRGKDVVFNFISSWFVYGHTEMPATEESICSPTGFYSITKKAAEDLLICYCKTFDIKYRILRLANVVGAGDPKASPRKNALQYMINEMKQHKDINLYEGGELYRDYIHVADVANAIRLVMNKGNVNEIYNIGNGSPFLLKDMVNYAHHKLNSRSKINFIKQPDFHKTVQVLSMWMKTDKLNQLGYRSTYNMHQMVEDMIK